MPLLERLLAGPHPVEVVVSQPDRRRGRGRRLSPPPVAEVARGAGVPLLQPEKVGAPEVVEALEARAPDLGVVAAYGQFIPKRVRELPRLGYCINAHASLLPRHRGAAPVQRAILAGDERTGISVMRVEREMDAGPVVLTRDTPIGPDENAGELEERLAALAADAIAEALDRIADGRAVFREQDHARATLAPKIERDETHLDWREDAEALARRVRALAPRPGAVTPLGGEPVRILAARALAGEHGEEPGRARGPDADGPFRIAAGRGWLVPLRLQRAGGRALDVDAFLRGRPVEDGARFGE